MCTEVFISTWVGLVSNHTNGKDFPLVSIETFGRASTTQSNKARLVGLCLELFHCFYPGRGPQLRFITAFLWGGGEGQFRGAGAGAQGRECWQKASIWRSPLVSISKSQVVSVTGAWALVPACPSSRATCRLPPEQPACCTGVPGVLWGTQAEERALRGRRGLDLRVFSFTFTE